ncbi:MAG: insulinase family protein [Deltaproteobacteria bacterium]|nr:insulinase family protein [Deltaproteobacteria bacterium]
MKLRFAKALLALLLACIFSSYSDAQTNDVFKTKLDNGMTVILEQDHSARVVAFQMFVRVGSADENEKEAGIAHVFEHMLFKGTERRKVGQIAGEVAAAGGYINAYTSYDQTVYHLAVASRYFDTGLDIISDAIQHSSFDPGELKKELEVVLEEIRMGEDNPGRKLYKNILSTAYTTHPYKKPVIGFTETVKSFTREQILDFFKKWYVPNNMTLVVVGDFDKNKAMDVIKNSFSDFKPGPEPHKTRASEPSQKEVRTTIANDEIKESHFGMAFHIPELSHPDTYAIDVLANILGQGESSRLYQRLKQKMQLVHSISTYAMTPKEPGVFFINANLEAKNAKRTIEEVMKELYKIRYEGVSLAELDKAKLNLESEFVYERETMEGRARQLGYFEVTAGDIAYEEKYIDGIAKVTSEDIGRMVRQYLKQDNMTVAVIVPKVDKDVVGKEDIIAAAGAASVQLSQAAEPRIEEIRKTTNKKAEGPVKIKLKNGITLIVKEDHSNPTVAIYSAFHGGLRFEDEKTNGLGNFLANMLTRGTEKRTSVELAREIEGMAGGVNGFSGKNSVGISGKFLSRYFNNGIEIVADCLLNPLFPQDEMEKVKKEVIANIKRQEDYLPGYTFKLFYKTLYEKHPYRMSVNGTEKTVSGFKRIDIVNHYKRLIVPQNMVISIVGDINRDEVAKKIEELFGSFNRKAKPLADLPIEGKRPHVKKTGDVKEKQQTHIALGFLGTTITSQAKYPLAVLTEALSSQGGRLFVELRDKQSLAYALSAFSKEGVEPGVFAVYIGTAPDKKDKAIDGILTELKKVITEKIPDEELKRAKSALIGGYEMGLQENSAQAPDMANNELFGLGFDEYKRYPGKIEAVTADDILKTAQRYINLDAYTLSVVGPK